MKSSDHLVCIVDDDERVREGLTELLGAAGFSSRAFGSVAEYLQHPPSSLPGCLVLDVRLPGINGLDFQRQLGTTEHVPIVFITGHGDVPMSVRAMKAGAFDFLTKPFSDEAFLGAVGSAIELDRELHRDRTELTGLKERYASLTAREREVLPLIVAGLLNKQGAAELRISPITFQIHRSNVMRKMGTRSVAELVRAAARLRVPTPQLAGEAAKP